MLGWACFLEADHSGWRGTGGSSRSLYIKLGPLLELVSHIYYHFWFHILNQVRQPGTERPRVTVKSLLFKGERSRHRVIDDTNKELLWVGGRGGGEGLVAF